MLRLSGVIITEQIDGYTIDVGPEALLTQKADCVADARRQAALAAGYIFARASEINDRTLAASR